MFKGFKVVGVCGVVGAGNNKVVRWCGDGVVTCKVINRVWIILLVWIILWIGWGWWGDEKTLAWALPNEKRSFYNGILTVAPIPIIQFTVYSTVKTVYQIEPKKIG